MKRTLYLIIILIFSSSLALIIISNRFAIPPEDFIAMIPEMIYPHPHINGFYGSSLTFYSFLYVFFTIMLLLSYLFYIVRKSEECTLLNYIKKYIFQTLCLVIFLTTVIQTSRNYNFLNDLTGQFKNLNTEEKLNNMFGKPYDFASKIKPLLPAKTQCQLITDLDINEPAGMSYERYFSYFLYPIQIRYIDKEPDPECLVFANKNDARAHIPTEYSILLEYDSKNILAKRN